jgi:hypothetical protein
MNLKQALDIIDSGLVFSLKVVKYDHRRKSGGELRFYSQLCATNPKKNWEKNVEKAAAKSNHYDNGTRNCYKCIEGVDTSAIVKIHFVHILEVNGESVML